MDDFTGGLVLLGVPAMVAVPLSVEGSQRPGDAGDGPGDAPREPAPTTCDGHSPPPR